MYTVTIFSNRLYLDENVITEDIDIMLENNIVEFRRIFYGVYNLCFLSIIDKDRYNKILEGTTLFKYVSRKYGTNVYYTNTLIRLVEGKVKEQVELQKQYIEDIEAKIATKTNSLKCKQKELADLRKMEERIIKHRRKLKEGKKSKLTAVKGLGFLKIDSNNVITVYDKGIEKEITLGELEYNYIFPKIRKCRNLIGKYKHKIDNYNIKLNKCKKLKRCIFGSKSFMREYNKGLHTKEEFLHNKYKSYQIGGRCDLYHGNRAITPIYNEGTDSFNFDIWLLDNSVIQLTNVRFPYFKEELIKIMEYPKDKGGKPICFGIHKKKDKSGRFYYQIRAVFDIECTYDDINYDKSTGVVAIDFNLGHIDMTELDSNGNLLTTKTLYYDMTNKSSLNEISLRKVLGEIGKYAEKVYKPIIIEDLDFTSLKHKCNTDKTQQRSLNRYIHSMPISKYSSIVESFKIKYKVDVETVNPDFTSIIGELKYTKPCKLSTHIAASMVIGRRGMNIIDYPTDTQLNKLREQKPLSTYKSNWALWSALNKLETA